MVFSHSHVRSVCLQEVDFTLYIDKFNAVKERNASGDTCRRPGLSTLSRLSPLSSNDECGTSLGSQKENLIFPKCAKMCRLLVCSEDITLVRNQVEATMGSCFIPSFNLARKL